MVKSKLKEIIDKKGLSIRKVAGDIEYRFETVRRMYNNDTKHYPQDLLDKLCTYLDIEVGELLVNKRGKDATFKANFKIEGMKRIEKFRSDSIDRYSPDLVFTDEQKNKLVIIEHSSTGDRKVHIGEMTQFVMYCKAKRVEDAYFFIFLDGAGATAPTVETVKKRLEYYAENLLSGIFKETNGIKFIGVLGCPEDVRVGEVTEKLGDLIKACSDNGGIVYKWQEKK